jgi:uncharacterized protein (DUF697 family)
MFDKVQKWFASLNRDARFKKRFELLRRRTPVPVFWLFGKTQSGKTSIIKYLTGAEQAEIGKGFKPCTHYSRRYEFPTPEAPLLIFLDTRGMDEPGYDPGEDLSSFDKLAHVLIVTVKALDHAQENMLRHLRQIRKSQPGRPVILALTCLHEAYPQQQHPQPYPFNNGDVNASVSESLTRSLAEQRERFKGLFDEVVPLDLTPPEEGFADPTYGGEQLKETVLGVLPSAFRQTLLTLEDAKRELQDLYARQALPHIAGYSTLAASAGAIPVPWLDLLIIPAVQSRMIFHLGQLYGQPLSATRFLEVASTLGIGMLMRQAARETVKFVPYVGSVAGGVASGVLAWASTFALGKAFCYYYSALHQGHVPRAEDLRRYYQEQLAAAEHYWSTVRTRG